MIYIINQYCTDTLKGRLYYATQDKDRAWKEYLDIVHEIACCEFDESAPEYFLKKEYNTSADLAHINDWEELAEDKQEIYYYDRSSDSRIRIDFVEWDNTS